MNGIVFKKIRFKNFLATGNNFIEIDLNKDARTLIIGENGVGKSTMLCALTFALFGKSFRNANKPTLVNSINEKDCLVECEFSIGKTNYKVRRGMKPNIFEVYQNGKLCDQESKTKDYQKYLEQNILKLNYKTFTQIVILGASNFTPFMQLTAADRRDVIEDLLDIQIFSQMNTILKDEISTNRQELNDYTHKLELAKEKMNLHLEHIKQLESKDKQLIQEKQNEIDETKSTIKLLREEVDKLNDNIKVLEKQLHDEKVLTETMNKLSHVKSKAVNRIDAILKRQKFFEEHSKCPTCEQEIEEEFKTSLLKEDLNQKDKITDVLKSIESDIQDSLNKISHNDTLRTKINNLLKDANTKNSSIIGLTEYVDKLKTFIDKTQSESNETNKQETETKLSEYQQEYDKAKQQIDHLKDDYHYYKLAEELLKDRGIKSKIIKQYLPVMNKLINKYLQSLDFFVSFHLDENFKESVKSRYRDEFSYNSFSEGQKFRIDIAILLAWRDIARMKNSTNTNLLILDEVFDSSLDSTGVDDFMKLLETVSAQNTNVFVISHRGQTMIDKFNTVLEFSMQKNFTHMEERQ